LTPQTDENQLMSQGNAIVVIEHNLEVMKQTPSAATHAWDYGSRPSPGRRILWPVRIQQIASVRGMG
jgi:hypothetical protein